MSKISRKHQVTVPVDVLREAGLQPGDDVRIHAAGPGRVELVRVDELVDEFAGAFDSKAYPPGYLEDVRDEWQ